MNFDMIPPQFNDEDHYDSVLLLFVEFLSVHYLSTLSLRARKLVSQSHPPLLVHFQPLLSPGVKMGGVMSVKPAIPPPIMYLHTATF
jgi:hypothetical protein